MITIKDLLGNVAGNLKKGLGIQPADLQRMEKAEKEAAERMTATEDRLQALREEIKRAEGRILHRKREYDKETGGAKRMLGREIERMVRRLSPLEREHEIQLDNQDATFALTSKIREVRALLNRFTEKDIDIVAVRLEDAIEAAENAEQAQESLNKLAVRTGESAAEKRESRTVDLDRAEPAAGLNEDTAAFLRQLEADQES